MVKERNKQASKHAWKFEPQIFIELAKSSIKIDNSTDKKATTNLFNY